MSITKNENGTLSIGDIQIVSSYEKESKKHTFNLLKAGCVPVKHVGNHLTLRNNLSKLVAELESTFAPLEGEVASEVVSEDILNEVEFTEFEVNENAPTSENEDYNFLKEVLEKFTSAESEEERDTAAFTASNLILNMDLETV